MLMIPHSYEIVFVVDLYTEKNTLLTLFQTGSSSIVGGYILRVVPILSEYYSPIIIGTMNLS